jgi:hypothetical protein
MSKTVRFKRAMLASMPGRKIRNFWQIQAALDHVFDREMARLCECHIHHAHGLGPCETVDAGIAAIASGMAWAALCCAASCDFDIQV